MLQVPSKEVVETSKVLAAAAGGFLSWILISGIGLAVSRMRLKGYLKTAINLHIAELKDNGRWLEKMMKTIVVGRNVVGAPLYTRDDLKDLTDVRARAIELLTESETQLLLKAIYIFWEVESLLEGLCAGLREYQATGKALDEQYVEQFNLRSNRIMAILRILPNKLVKFGDLPADYDGRISAESLVPSKSQADPSKVAEIKGQA